MEEGCRGPEDQAPTPARGERRAWRGGDQLAPIAREVGEPGPGPKQGGERGSLRAPSPGGAGTNTPPLPEPPGGLTWPLRC